MDREQIPDLISSAVVASTVSEIAAKEKHITSAARHRLSGRRRTIA
jgi:hypothetical protein